MIRRAIDISIGIGAPGNKSQEIMMKKLQGPKLWFSSIVIATFSSNTLAECDADTTSKSNRLPTALVYDARYADHNAGETHPERPARVEHIMARLRQSDLWGGLSHLAPIEATLGQLRLVHQEQYLNELQEAEDVAPVNLDPDTVMGEGSFGVARLAAGGAVKAVDAVFSGAVENAFVASRPPGHHAFTDRASGFCFLNNVAIAARHAIETYPIDRVLIVDWDVHHGNATQDIFYDDANVMYFSTHQYPYYPFTGLKEEIGQGGGAGTNINVPLPAGSGGIEVLEAYRDILMPAADDFKPQLILISAGFDSHADDPLASFRLIASDFDKMTSIVKDIADRYADGRIVSVLEGGYHLDNLANAVESHLRRLAERPDC